MSDLTHATAEVDAGHHDVHADYSLATVSIYLMVLTFATSCSLILQNSVGFWQAGTNTLFVFMISVLKASIVVGLFMHFKYEKSWKYAVTIPACCLCVAMVCALLPDIGQGTWPKEAWAPYINLAGPTVHASPAH
jgi:caa(3)-type oxidase subunit IV